MLVSGGVCTSTDYNSCYQALSPFFLLRSFEILQKHRRLLTVNVPLFPKKTKRYSKILHSRKSWKTWGSWYITISYDQPKPCTISLQEQIHFKISIYLHKVWSHKKNVEFDKASRGPTLGQNQNPSCLSNFHWVAWEMRRFSTEMSSDPPILPRWTCHVTSFNLFVGHFGQESCYNQKHHHRNDSLEPPEITTTLACKRF